jgi:type IV pilus assembly protein PilB
MILTSGPTGSGKSTSLYALIQEIKNDSINIVTLEDPVEYKMGGINQIQVNSRGRAYVCIWSALNPCGKTPMSLWLVRFETERRRQLAVQAALTGHLVFSARLHTNSAAGILPRSA